MRKFPISSANQSDIRVFVILASLVKPYVPYDPATNPTPVKVPPPSEAVMRAYIKYMLDVLNTLEQKEPGYLQIRRRVLLSLWIPVQQSAPDMAGLFLNLEGRSRRPGEPSFLPMASTENEASAKYERKVKDGLKSDQPSEGVIYAAISKGDFDKARKMIDKLPEGARKKQLNDMTNAEEVISLTAKDKINEAETLAGKLNRADSVLKVYPVIIGKCVAKKDQPCAIRLIYQSLKQVKTSETLPALTPEGIPASAIVSDQRFDPILSFIARLATELVRYDADLAFEVVNELVSTANARPLDRDQPLTLFDVAVFKRLAAKDEMRVQQTAYSLKNPIQRVLALAAFYQ